MNYACSFQTVCSALNTLCPFTTIWAHENDSIASIFHLAQYQNNFVSWVGFCLSPHVLYFTEGMSYHTFAWFLMFVCTIFGQISSGGSTLGGATALGINQVQRVECTQTWGVNFKNVFFLSTIGLATCCHATLVHVAQLGPQHVPNLSGHWNKFFSWSEIKLKTVHNLSGRIEKDMKVTCLLVMILSLFLEKICGWEISKEHKTDSWNWKFRIGPTRWHIRRCQARW